MLIKSFPDFDPDESSIKFQIIIYSVFSKFKLTGSIKYLIFIWWQ